MIFVALEFYDFQVFLVFFFKHDHEFHRGEKVIFYSEQL